MPGGPCEARSAFGLASVAVVCFGCEVVTQSLWSKAWAEVEGAGGVGDLSMVPCPSLKGWHTSCRRGLSWPIFRPREVAAHPEVVQAPGAVLVSRWGRIGFPVRRVIKAGPSLADLIGSYLCAAHAGREH